MYVLAWGGGGGGGGAGARPPLSAKVGNGRKRWIRAHLFVLVEMSLEHVLNCQTVIWENETNGGIKVADG